MNNCWFEREWAGLFRVLLCCIVWLGVTPVHAQGASASSPSPGAAGRPTEVAAPVADERRWLGVPRVQGRLSAAALGIVINQDDAYSVQVGGHYARARGIPEQRILRVSLPVRGALTVPEFDALKRQIDAFFGPEVQALALPWRQPYAVECQSITGVLALGFDPKLCSATCGPPVRPSPYFGSASRNPLRDHGMRLSMLLAAPDEATARRLIDRGVQSDGTLTWRSPQPARVHFVTTSDAVRSVRQTLFPPEGPLPALGLEVRLDRTDALRGAERVLIYLTGRTHVDWLDTVQFLPGALADHLTSFGGLLDKAHGQMTVMSWIQAGVTATYGTVSEPCAHLQKFPHPQALLLFYSQGSTALEAYWKSVAWPQQGLFVGEPLAAPFARPGDLFQLR